MTIECPHCESRVHCEIVGDVDVTAEGWDPSKVSLAKCTLCKRPLVGYTQLYQTGSNEWDWSDLTRLWPEPARDFDRNIPDIVRSSLEEAENCIKAKAYMACAVMAGRAVEGACQHHLGETTIAKGLKALRDKDLIDDRLFGWGEELRKHRNMGAHPSAEKISRADARDLLDFALSICEYMFVLRAKFERFQDRAKRRARRRARKIAEAKK